MKFFLVISRIIDAMTGLLGRVTWWVSLAMVIIGAFNVLTRYAFDIIADLFGNDVAHALSGNRYLSMQTFAYDLVFMLGAAYVLSQDGHVRVDILFSRFGAKARAWIDIFGAIFFLIPFCLLGINFSQNYVGNSISKLEASGDPGGIPFFIFKGVDPRDVRAADRTGGLRDNQEHRLPAGCGQERKRARTGPRPRRRWGHPGTRSYLMLGLWMFLAAIGLLLIGYPVAFSLGGVALLFTLIAAT